MQTAIYDLCGVIGTVPSFDLSKTANGFVVWPKSTNSIVVGKNCGTGDGGFKPGNVCATGGGGAGASGGGGGSSAESLGAEKFTAFASELKLSTKVRVELSDGTAFVGRGVSRAGDGSVVMLRGKIEGTPGRGTDVRSFRATDKSVVGISSVPDIGKSGKSAASKPSKIEASQTSAATEKIFGKHDAVRSGMSTTEDQTKAMASQVSGLSKADTKAVQDYTLSHYGIVNWDLNHGKEVRSTGGADKVDKRLEKITSQDLPVPVKSYRIIGISDDLERDGFWSMMEEAHSTNKAITLPAYTSTTLDAAQAVTGKRSKANTQITLEIVAKRGAYVDEISKNSGEKELLLPKGSKFRVHGIRDVSFMKSSGETAVQTVVQMEQL